MKLRRVGPGLPMGVGCPAGDVGEGAPDEYEVSVTANRYGYAGC